MKKTIQLQLPATTAFNEQLLKEEIAAQLSLNPNDTFSIQPVKRSIDARGRNIKINLTVDVYINESIPEFSYTPDYKHCTS
ncbi:MAG TPA: FAD-binding protein, partial [Bacteroidia bacterium]|nr:FAD-binding protein [Bacteroidia bacterium]